jgi:zinc transport system substrate-binding protein
MAKLARADVFFCVGVPFERQFVETLASAAKNLRVVQTQAGIHLRLAEVGHECDHEHDHRDHLHPVGRLDPHTWLDPALVKVQAGAICDALCEIDPRHADDYKRNLASFRADLDAVRAEITKTLAPLECRDFLVFHPAYGYFADAFGLRQIPVEVEGKEPSARQLADLIALAREKGLKVIFVQPQSPDTAARALARSIGGRVVALDPLASDYLENLRRMAASIKEAAPRPQGTK